MLFNFRPEHMIGLANGTLTQVVSASGQPLSIVRNATTGQFVSHAVGIASQPFVAVPQMLLSGAQMLQTHKGFQKTYQMLDAVQRNLGVLQATTSLIGVGTVAGVALSAVNFHQTLKLKQDVKQLRLEVKEGFINLKQAFRDVASEIIERIDQVAQDVEFKQHRTILSQAYGRFTIAIQRLQSALKIQDINQRYAEINAGRDMLFQALADYDNPNLLEGSCCAGQLRRQECVWAINQAIILTYQLQNAHEVVIPRLKELQNKINQDIFMIAEKCDNHDELDFIFPEILRIKNHDLVVLDSWYNHVDWLKTLPSKEQHILYSLENVDSNLSNYEQDSIVAIPEEQLVYDNLNEQYHYYSLLSQLKLQLKPELRENYQSYINESAIEFDYGALAVSNWQDIPDWTVANLYWYFKFREDSIDEV